MTAGNGLEHLRTTDMGVLGITAKQLLHIESRLEWKLARFQKKCSFATPATTLLVVIRGISYWVLNGTIPWIKWPRVAMRLESVVVHIPILKRFGEVIIIHSDWTPQCTPSGKALIRQSSLLKRSSESDDSMPLGNSARCLWRKDSVYPLAILDS